MLTYHWYVNNVTYVIYRMGTIMGRKKRLINQYNDFCHYCSMKVESIPTIVQEDQLYCEKLDEFFDVKELKKADIFCTDGRHKHADDDYIH